MASEPPGPQDRKVLIGRYEIIKRIGAGGMGAVYKARDLELGRVVALKVLPPDLASRPDMLERFRLEATHAAHLRHEHIVTLYEFGTCNGTYFLAMEFVEGRNLHEYIDEKGKLGPDEARKLILQGARALALAHEKGIVHRDIKPSNFLLTEKDGRPFVKLTDFGLARGLDDSDFKVTRTGTTVGTVDYISPEQARSSRAADIRSDIYSLGCTLYHMLSGQPPFPEGDLTERLLKHVEAQPADVRQVNPDVPAGLVLVLSQMMAKKPEERYQTPADLIKDLEHLPTPSILNPRELLEALAPEPRVKPKPARGPAGTTKFGAAGKTRTLNVPAEPAEVPKLRYRGPKAGKERRRKKSLEQAPSFFVVSGWKAWAVVLGSGTVVVLLLLALSLGWGGRPSARSADDTLAADGGEPRNDARTERKPKDAREAAEPVDNRKVVNQLAKEQNLSPIYRPGEEATRELEKEFHGRAVPPLPDATSSQDNPPRHPPGTAPPTLDRPPPVGIDPAQPATDGSKTKPDPIQAPGEPPANQPGNAPDPQGVIPTVPKRAPVYVVSRTAGTGANRHFDSLTVACARAFAQETAKTVVVEIRDNGPLFERPVVVSGRNLVLRAGKGFRPLLAWDVQAAGSHPGYFLTVREGDLFLENLDVVLKRPEASAPATAGLVRVEAGSLSAEDCTFSVSGRGPGGVAVVQLADSHKDGRRCGCHLKRCFVRGADIMALDVRAPATEVVIDHCLFLGGSQPLLDVQGYKGASAAVLRLLRSTLVAGQTLMRVRPTSEHDKKPAVDWLSWDTLLARYGGQAGGVLLDLDDGAEPAAMKWRAVNCLYTGWATLLKSDARTVGAEDGQSAWRELWHQEAGDAVKRMPWPGFVPADPADAMPGVCSVSGTPAEFRATSGPGTLGCDVAAVPPGREGWLTWTYERAPLPSFEPPPLDQPPEVANPGDGSYHGGRLDLSGDNIDLGEYLKAVQEKHRLAPKVVLHLDGRREVKTSPIQVRGTSLVLYFEPPQSEGDRLVLVPRNGAGRKAFIEVEGGGFEMVGGVIRYPVARNVPEPEFLLKVQGGDVRLTGCRLEGAVGHPPEGQQGLIFFQGSGQRAAHQAHECVLADTILLSGKTCVHTLAAGALVRLRNCLVVAGGDAFRLEPGSAPVGRLNAQCVLEHSTVATRQSVFHVADASKLAAPVEPLVIQARANLFLDPFAGSVHQAAILRYDSDALVHGLVVWQGDGNVYDKHYHTYVTAADAAPGAQQSHAIFERLWGPLGDRQASFLDMPTARMIDPDKLALDRLAVPGSFRPKGKGLPGADLAQLGIAQKPVRKPQ
jgi:serine/threonine-protein kinase